MTLSVKKAGDSVEITLCGNPVGQGAQIVVKLSKSDAVHLRRELARLTKKKG